MTTRATYSISAKAGLFLLVLSFAAVSYLLSQLHGSFTTNVLIGMLTGWALVIIYATGATKNSIERIVASHRRRQADRQIAKEVRMKTKRLRKQKVTPMKQVTLSNGHVVNVA
ncbi:MAG: hypothetical protein ACPGKS_03750 [Coraliomargarita sp.]